MPTYATGKGITRFELTSSHGYLVRLCRQGKKFSEFFSDRQYGGKRKAKKAAQQRYEKLCLDLGPSNSRPTKNLLTQRNTSGKVGVHIAHSLDSRWANCEYTSYCASWIAGNGQRQKISFSWNKYGKSVAYELACLARKLESRDRAELLKIIGRRRTRRKVSVASSGKASRRT